MKENSNKSTQTKPAITRANLSKMQKFESDFRKEFGSLLRDLRIQRGYTMRELSAKSCVALGYISELERGKKEASGIILRSILDALNIRSSLLYYALSQRLRLAELHLALRMQDISATNIPDFVPDSLVQEVKRSLGKPSVGKKLSTA